MKKDARPDRNGTIPGISWSASDKKKKDAILFYLGTDNNRPKRFGELYQNIRGICSSKHTLLVYLGQLVKEGLVTRDKQSHKDVRYSRAATGFRVRKLFLEHTLVPVKTSDGKMKLCICLMGQDRKEYVPQYLLPDIIKHGWVFTDSHDIHFRYNYTKEVTEYLASKLIIFEKREALKEVEEFLLTARELSSMIKRKDFLERFGPQQQVVTS